MVNLTFLLSWLEPILCVLGLLMIVRAKQIGSYRYLAGLLATRFLSNLLLLPLLHYPKMLHLSGAQAYEAYFYIYWASDAIEAVLGFGIILSIYRLAMEPLEGLQRLGMLMFRWAAFISVALALSIAISPHITSSNFVTRVVSQLQQTQSVLTLCMLVFVCIAIRPMGLTHRSRIFGVSVGLALMAATDLTTAAWMSHSPDLYSVISIVGGSATLFAFSTWIFYFLVPEPARKMILVPTTSPFFHWNEISKALGDAPGFVAVGPVTLDNFAPAELEVMRRASDKMDRALTA